MAGVTDQEVFDHFPNVYLNADNFEHYRGRLERRLLIKRCQECSYWVYPHFPSCPQCWSTNLKFEEVSGKGKVYILTIFHQVRPGDDLPVPYAAAGVELDEREGLRYVGPIVNSRPEDVTLDMRVELVWIDRMGAPSVAWQPAGSG